MPAVRKSSSRFAVGPQAIMNALAPLLGLGATPTNGGVMATISRLSAGASAVIVLRLLLDQLPTKIIDTVYAFIKRRLERCEYQVDGSPNAESCGAAADVPDIYRKAFIGVADAAYAWLMAWIATDAAVQARMSSVISITVESGALGAGRGLGAAERLRNPDSASTSASTARAAASQTVVGVVGIAARSLAGRLMARSDVTWTKGAISGCIVPCSSEWVLVDTGVASIIVRRG
jgi:hypothetical protein